MSFLGKNKDKLKKSKSNMSRNMKYNVIIAGAIGVAFILLMVHARTYKKEIKVVSLKDNVSNSIITANDIVALGVTERDFKKGMIKWEDREKMVVDKFPNMQIRKETPVYEDMITENQKLRYQYLYELTPDEEVITFPYNIAEAGGRIPKPGDRFRIRGSYVLDKDEVATIEGRLIQEGAGEDVRDDSGNIVIKSANEGDVILGNTRTSLLFDVVTVVDMLNSDKDSIYEVSRDLEDLPKTQQEELLKDDNFKQKVTPDSILIIVNSRDVSKYASFKANNEVQYTITMLTRDKSLMEDDIKMGNTLLDSLGGESPVEDTSTPEVDVPSDN